MILIDTSVWVDHLNASDEGVKGLLSEGRILLHPFVIGELAMGNLKRRASILEDLTKLPHMEPVMNRDLLDFVARNGIFGLGVGFVDAHLLAAVLSRPGTSFWTRDKRLHRQAMRLGCAYSAPGTMVA